MCVCVCGAAQKGKEGTIKAIWQVIFRSCAPHIQKKIPRAARSTPKLENFSCAAHPSSAVCAQGKRCNCVDKMKCVIYILMADFRQLSKLYYVDYFPECMEIYAVWFSQCFKMMGVSLYIFLVYTKNIFNIPGFATWFDIIFGRSCGNTLNNNFANFSSHHQRQGRDFLLWGSVLPL